MPVETALIANCSLCDSYFVTVCGKYDLQLYKGRKGTKQLEDEIEQEQVMMQ